MKVAKEELTDLKSEFNSNMKDTLRKLEQVQNKINHIQKMQSFQGKTADTAKQYFHTVHGKIVTELQSTIGLLQTNLNDIHSEFTQNVDQSQTAILTEDHLNETDKKVLSIEKNLITTHKKGEQTVREVSDLVSVYMPSIASIETSIRNSSKYIQSVNEDLYNYDRSALKKVNESREKVKKLNTKLNNYVKISHKQNSMKDLDLKDYEVKGTSDQTTNGNFFVALNAGYGVYKKFSKYLNKANNTTELLAKFYIYSKVNRRDYSRLVLQGANTLTKAQLTKFNNILAQSAIYKFNYKTFFNHVKQYKFSSFTGNHLNELKSGLQVFTQERGKLAMIREFEDKMGFVKYRGFRNQIKTNPLKVTATTFNDEFIGNKYKSVKKVVTDLPTWTNPSQAYRNMVETFNESTKGMNKLGKGMKALGKGLGPLSFGIIANDNYKKYKGDTQKIVVGTAVDTAFSAGATTAGALAGSAFLPPLGTVLGAGVGFGASLIVNKKYGKPPKSVTEHTKDFVNKGVDSISKTTKEIGKSLTKWFK